MAGTRKVRHEIELTGEQKYKAGLKNIENGLKGNKAAMTALNAEYGKGDKSIEGLTKRQALLTDKLEQQRQKMTMIKAEYDKVVAAQGKNSERAQTLARDYDYARAAVTRTEKELADLNKTTEKATSRMEQFKAKLKEGGGELDKIGKKVADVGAKLKYVSAAAAGVLVGGAKAAIDFETAVTKLDVITRGELGAENMSRGLINASNELGEAVGGLAEAQYQAISAGIEAGDSLGYTVSAAKAAKAGYADVTTVVKGSTSVINAWKMSADEIPGMFDKLILSLDLGKAELGELSTQIGQITGLAPQLGVSFDEILASTAALTMNGQQTSSAINGLKNIMSGVLKPTKEARDEAKALGLAFDAAALRSKGLAGFLQDVMDKTGGSEEKFAKLFGSVEGLSSALLLTGNAADAFKENLAELANAGGTVDRVIGRIGQTQAQKFQVSWNKMQNSMIRFGQTLAPTVNMIGGLFERLANAAAGMSEEQMKFASGLLMATAAIGPAVIGTGKLIQAFAQIKTATAALSALVGGGGVLAGIGLGIAGITAGVIALKNHMDSLSGTNRIKAAFGKMNIDTGEIDKAIEAAESVTHELELTTQAKIKLSNDSSDLNAQIIAWLSDGQKETAKQKEEYKAKALEVVQPVYDGIKAAFDEKKAALDQQLAGGIIDKATYDARLNELKTTTDATKTSLDAESQAYISYVLTLAANGTKPTEEQLAKLEELRQKIVDVGQSILEAQNTATQAAKASYTATASGRGSKEDIAKGTAYVKAETEIKMANVDTAHQQAMADLQTKWDAANKAGDADLKMEVEADIAIESKRYEANKEKVQMEYSAMMSKLIDGIALNNPEIAAKIKDIASKQNIYEQMLRAMMDYNSAETPDEWNAASKAYLDLYNNLFPDDAWEDNDATRALAKQKIDQFADQYKKDIATTLEGTDFTALFSDLSTAISAGAVEGIDLSGVSDTTKDMISAIDLADDGKTLTESLILGEISGITDNQGDLNAAIIQSATDANNAFRAAQGIHSPSTVWWEYGTNLMMGLKRGVDHTKPLVTSSLDALSTQMKTIGAQSIQGMINGAESKRTALVNKYKALGLAADRAARDALDVRSPSRKFMEIGRYTGEGMIRGLEATKNRVQQAMTQMVSPVNMQVSRQATEPATVFGGQSAPITIATHINYTGAVTGRDSRKLGRQMGQIQRMALLGKGGK